MKLIAERNVDDLGRIVLPVEIRKKLGITSKSTISIYEDNGYVVMKQAEPYCKLCGSAENVNNELHLCTDCISKVKEY